MDGAIKALAMPIPKTITTRAHGAGLPFQATIASTTDRLPCTADPAMMMWRRSKRSASTPPTGEASSIGPSWANDTRPTKAPEWVSWLASAISVTFCIHVPMLDAKAPAATRRNGWWLSAAPTVPWRRPLRSPEGRRRRRRRSVGSASAVGSRTSVGRSSPLSS